MNTRIFTFLLSAFLVSLAGCSSSAKGPVKMPDPRTLDGENREWWDIFKVEFEADQKIYTRMGYLYRKYDERNPKGYYWVEDPTMKKVGFLLPDFTAYRVTYPSTPGKEPDTHELKTNSLESGIKMILGIEGLMELKKVLPAPSGILTPSSTDSSSS